MDGGLYIVGTPIGNLGDMTARGIETLKSASLILAEDTRQTRKLLTHFEIKTHCISCHKFNEAQRCEEILSRIQSGNVIAMVTDSGMPCVSDPGSRIVAACREANVMVTCAPGPTALSTAIALSGFGGHGFVFAGFAPRKSGARHRLLEQHKELAVPLILYESPYRLIKLIAEIGEVFGEKRKLFIARELTKLHEELILGTTAEIQQKFEGRTVKGECVVIISPFEPVFDS